MTAATETAGASGASSPTGYEAFIKTSNESVSSAKPQEDENLEQTKDSKKSPEAKEAWSTSVVESAAACTEMTKDGAQTMITNYFPTKNGCGPVPGLAASSSSNKSGIEEGKEKESKGEESSWADKMTNKCHMDMVCGKLDIECVKEVDEPPLGAVLTKKGESLKIEGPLPPKPWTQEITDKIQEAQNSAAKNANDLLISIGLATKKDQHLMTDYYKAKSEPTEPEKSIAEKIQDVVSTSVTEISTSAQNLVPTGMSNMTSDGMEEKKKVQQKMTDYSEISTVESIKTEAPSGEEKPPEEEKPSSEEKKSFSWNPWKQMKSFMSKLKPPKKTPSCSETEDWAMACTVPKAELPSCPAPKDEVPSCADTKASISSFSIFSCSPQTYENKPRTTPLAKAEEGGKVEEAKKPEDANADREAQGDKA